MTIKGELPYLQSTYYPRYSDGLHVDLTRTPQPRGSITASIPNKTDDTEQQQEHHKKTRRGKKKQQGEQPKQEAEVLDLTSASCTKVPMPGSSYSAKRFEAWTKSGKPKHNRSKEAAEQRNAQRRPRLEQLHNRWSSIQTQRKERQAAREANEPPKGEPSSSSRPVKQQADQQEEE